MRNSIHTNISASVLPDITDQPTLFRQLFHYKSTDILHTNHYQSNNTRHWQPTNVYTQIKKLLLFFQPHSLFHERMKK
jgi:hypothetical protein